MTWLYLTAFCFFVVFLPYEIHCVVSGKPTFSATVTGVSRRYPLIGFLIGCLFGGLAIHFFTEGNPAYVDGDEPKLTG